MAHFNVRASLDFVICQSMVGLVIWVISQYFEPDTRVWGEMVELEYHIKGLNLLTKVLKKFGLFPYHHMVLTRACKFEVENRISNTIRRKKSFEFYSREYYFITRYSLQDSIQNNVHLHHYHKQNYIKILQVLTKVSTLLVNPS